MHATPMRLIGQPKVPIRLPRREVHSSVVPPNRLPSGRDLTRAIQHVRRALTIRRERARPIARRPTECRFAVTPAVVEFITTMVQLGMDARSGRNIAIS